MNMKFKSKLISIAAFFILLFGGVIHAETNKTEQFHRFAKLLFFGGEGIIAENLATLTGEGAYDDAFSHWLQGVFFLRCSTEPADREKARKELLAGRSLREVYDKYGVL